ncbi:phosphate acetyltransferase [Desulfobulbus alkaliphilus]|uniref:phosphate acetyltransferase n=1 Tax=Desulfobulbus alkaliphilus TaxID=869814 RepID=UPI0019655913|nr:phosphate acetyltransferase [Desulfobulbus alkaliphilus]MBM9536517.1 phosphate acetyltransferase [Desulfobulbus alkaliphilus]
MADSLYIANLEIECGKLVVTLGVMELLSRRIGHVGFFRPITPGDGTNDNDINLIRHRYNIDLTEEEMVGISHDEARSLVANGQEQLLFRRIVGKFVEVRKKCDFLLCEGPNIVSMSEAFDYDISIRIARELGTPTLHVVNARNRGVDEIQGNIRVAEKIYEQYQCPLLAMFVNRIDPDLFTAAKEQIKASHQEKSYRLDFLPEMKGFSMPTMEEITEALGARHFSGPPAAGRQSDIHAIKVAAMSPANFIDFLEEDDLIITPGDRPDIILATLGAIASRHYPSPAGLLLSGGFEPSPSMVRLLDGIDNLPLSMYLIPGDTYKAAMRAGEVKGVLQPHNEQKTARALGVFESHVDTVGLEQQVIDTVTTIMSPLMFEYSLFQQARAERKHIVLPEGYDERILQAAEILRSREVVDLTLLGDEKTIRSRGATLGLKLQDVSIIDPKTSPLREEFIENLYQLRKHKGFTRDYAQDAINDVSYFGTMMVHTGRADGMVSGAVHTTEHTIRPAFQIIRTRPEVLVVSSVFFMCLETRVLVYGDCAVNPNPDSEQLAEIAIRSAETAAMFNIEPIVAMLSYSSGSSGHGEDVEQVRRAVALARTLRPDLKIDGPIQYDAAIDISVGSQKMPESEVAGRATVFIFPDLNTGNNTYKAVQRSAGAVAIGPILQGLNKPVNDLSRGCLVPDIVNTVAITAIQAQALAKKHQEEA